MAVPMGFETTIIVNSTLWSVILWQSLWDLKLPIQLRFVARRVDFMAVPMGFETQIRIYPLDARHRHFMAVPMGFETLCLGSHL